ncbi:uncharacterized protein LOC131981386 [Centropristis striata]|uniref:uncharacterized protein LOC131981386 n=1 Tax=Centropristis striata TaxID=184440 RepID=UPI0027DFB91C|nr:uncharacterized protein LOC131981386 [Centropristis striata]
MDAERVSLWRGARTVNLRHTDLTITNISRIFKLIPSSIYLVKDSGDVLLLSPTGYIDDFDDLHRCEVRGDEDRSAFQVTPARVDMLTVHAMKKNVTLHQALSTRYVKTCQRLTDETARPGELQTQLQCSDETVSQWTSDVKEWAADEMPKTSDSTEDTANTGLQQSIEGRYLSVTQRKQTLYRQNGNIIIKKQLHDQVMLTMRLREEKNVLVLEMAQHCTWLQNVAVVLKNRVAEEGTGSEGLRCILRRRIQRRQQHFQRC